VLTAWIAEYVIVLTGRELRGRLMGHEVYRATNFDILPLNPNISTDSPPHPVEEHLLALVRSHLHGGNFLFSYEWDLTRRMQAQWGTRDKEAGKYFWEMVLPGLHLCYQFIHFSCSRWMTVSSGIGMRPYKVLRGPSLQREIIRFLQTRLIDAANGNVNANV
jgi:hypothetical protein